ncbi:transcription factor Opi1-domain-containing protein [Tricharina praecox]|uniref:transcription factor Opi1-domain-containing protein n=1 Tax=Tricharina praecox TaxID=43433 RepID=UPI002220D74C|nr:transcription factor Opi1-domain-containing protein [Tricharina praecox]KAI5844201.1 transcription factor Opi1-domain-containing protein [Tricharina praecox]
MKRKGSDIIDRDEDAMARSSRGTSVMSTTGLSMEDPDVRDAVEALGGLKADFAHPLTAPNSPPNQQEPLLNLIQSSASSVHPLLSTALSISSSTYNASKNYIPPFRYVAESAENVAAPVVRRTGLENYIRRGLTRHRSNDKAEPNGGEKKRRKSEKEPAPATPEKQLVEVQNSRERGWQTRLYYSSTGLATALSDESRRSLKYCLKILLAANGNLMKVIATLTNVVDELDQYLSQKCGEGSSAPTSPPLGVAGYLGEGYEQRRQHLAETVDRLKDEALKTLKVVVDTISRYAGGALPEHARNVVKRQLLSFPLKWQAATSSTSSGDVEQGVTIAEPEDDTGRRTKGKAVRVLMMAREGLDMMRGVAEVVDGTLVSAEEWCERFGKKTDEQEDGSLPEKDERKRVSWMDAPTATTTTNATTATPEREADGDVSMAKAG